MENDWKKAQNGEIIKFEKDNDSIEGIYLGYEPSSQFEDSFIVKISDENREIKAVFVSGIVIGLIRDNQIKIGDSVKIVFKGLKDNKAKTRQYKDYEVYFK